MNELKNNILLISRPISPPWNEGTKNIFSYLSTINSNFLTLTSHKRVNSYNIYKNQSWTLKNKILLLKFLIFSKEILKIKNFLIAFTPNFFNSLVISWIIKSRVPDAELIQFLPSIKKKSMLVGNKFICISKYTKNKLLQSYAIDENNIFLLKPFVSISMSSSSIIDISKKDNSKYLVSYFGEYSKRLDSFPLILEIIKKTIAINPNIAFLLACRTFNLREKVRELYFKRKAKKMGLSNNIIFKNKLKNIYHWIVKSDMTIFPVKKMQGKFDIPLVIIESLLFNKPTLISKIEPFKTAFKHEKKFEFLLINSIVAENWANQIIKILNTKKQENYSLLEKKYFSKPKSVDKLIRFIFK